MPDIQELAEAFLTDERMRAFSDVKAQALSERALAHREAEAAHERTTRAASEAYKNRIRIAALEQLKLEIAEQEKASEQRASERDRT